MATVTYTYEDVARHNNEKDIWMVIHGGVYDLTKFLQEHPGGEEVLLKQAGIDGTYCFDEMGHTTEAVQLRETFKIGEIAAGSVLPTGNSDNVESVGSEDDEWYLGEQEQEKSSNLLFTFVGIGIAIYAWLFYTFSS